MQVEGIAESLAMDLPGTFEGFVRAYQDRLYSFGLHLCGQPLDAEEIAQDTFVRAYRALERYPAERIRALQLRPWLFQIALNVFRNRIRGKTLDLVSLEPTPDGPVFEPAAELSDGPVRLAERAEERRLLQKLLLGLPERQRIAVALRHVQGLSYDEIARLLGQPAGTVKANVHRGVRALRASMEDMPEAAGMAPGRGVRWNDG